jgi:hypothetical protein
MDEYPALRPVEAFPVKAQGEDYICLRDPTGLASHPIFLNRTSIFLVSRMNGSNSLRDIQADFMRATGEIVPMEHLQSLAAQLDEQHYLNSSQFRDYYEGVVQEFLQKPVRTASHAGGAYDATSEGLKNQIRSFFADPDGPGTATAPTETAPRLRGLIAPHIDFHRGGPTYAHAYHALGEPQSTRFIVFGTCHTQMKRRFALTRKHFDTPLGVAETDSEFVDRMALRLSLDYFEDEFSHRGEHSLEFQAVMLKYILPAQGAFRIVPILVGSFHDFCDDGRTPGEDGEIREFLQAFAETLSEHPARDTIIAAADLAHVGRRFGDQDGPTSSSMSAVEEGDRRFLGLVAAGDAEGMFRSIATDNDSRRVCGYPPIYMLLRALHNPRGELLQYRQWVDFDSGAAVTYAALAFY